MKFNRNKNKTFSYDLPKDYVEEPTTRRVIASHLQGWRQTLRSMRIRWSLGFRITAYGFLAKMTGWFWSKQYKERVPHFEFSTEPANELVKEAADRARKIAGWTDDTMVYIPGGAAKMETLNEWVFQWYMRGLRKNWDMARKGKIFRRPKLDVFPVRDDPVRQQYPASWAYDPMNPDHYDEGEIASDPSIAQDLAVISGDVNDVAKSGLVNTRKP